METRKVLSGLCYFSVFFAGFIFPLVVLLASGDAITKGHAKKALLSHLIPLIPVPILIFAIFNDISVLQYQEQIPVFTMVMIVVTVLISVIVVIWNVIKGVKALIAE